MADRASAQTWAMNQRVYSPLQRVVLVALAQHHPEGRREGELVLEVACDTVLGVPEVSECLTRLLDLELIKTSNGVLSLAIP